LKSSYGGQDWVRLGSFWLCPLDIGPKLASFGFELGSNWVRFLVKSAFSGKKRIKLASFCKIECIWKYVIIERVPKVTKVPKVNYIRRDG
jgi:hypothetical protein